AGSASRSAQPLGECRVPRRARAGLEFRAQLADCAEALGENVVRVDRLQVDLSRVDEVLGRELGVALERRGERDADGVLHEARLQVRMLDDEQLVRTLQK